jgi:photosystem II stability/assembly factor-like uncharacterized protein
VNAPGQLQQWPPISIAADPYHPDVVFAVFAVDGTCGSIYKSLNGGASWARTDTPISPQFNGHCMNTLAIDPNAPATLYAAVKPSVFQVPDIYKTTDGGTTWSPLRPASYEEVFRVAVSRTNSNVLYATSTNAVLKSTDAGSTWAAIGTGLAFLPLEFERQIAIDPTDDNIVYLATALGVFVTTDGGVSWTARQNGWPTIHGLPHSARNCHRSVEPEHDLRQPRERAAFGSARECPRNGPVREYRPGRALGPRRRSGRHLRQRRGIRRQPRRLRGDGRRPFPPLACDLPPHSHT